MTRLVDSLLDILGRGEPVVLATIVSQQGSTPRTAGTKMAVLQDGSILGTIGGGRVEAEVMAAAREVLARGLARFQRFDLTNADAARMDMICGGRLEVLLEPLTPDAATIAAFSAQREVENGLCVTLLAQADGAPEGHLTAKRLLVAWGPSGVRVLGGGAELPAGLEPLLDEARGERCPVLLRAGSLLAVAEPVRPAGSVYLFGAGHVSQKLAVLADFVDFRVAVLDDRAEFANRERFPAAWRILVPESFDGIMAALGIGAEDYVVIVTRGHSHDMELLDQALRTRAGYIGMIGSRRKRDTVYAELRKRGLGDADFARVLCPIGLDIGAETPEEIAVSIAAELIQARAGRAVSAPAPLS